MTLVYKLPQINRVPSKSDRATRVHESHGGFNNENVASVMDDDFWFVTDTGLMINQNMTRHPEFAQYKKDNSRAIKKKNIKKKNLNL